MNNLSKIKLYGQLGERYGKEFEFHIDSIGEGIRALSANLKGFRQDISKNDYHIFIDDYNVDKEEVLGPLSKKGVVIKIVPIIQGAGGFFKAIIGGLLLGASFLLPGLGPLVGGLLRSIGTSLLFGGFSELFFSPKSENLTADPPSNAPNFAFQGSVNTITQGGPVPICYGELIVGSAVISAGITTTPR